MNIQKAHEFLGYDNEESTRKTALELGWILYQGTLKPCLHCAKAKAKQKMCVRKVQLPRLMLLEGESIWNFPRSQ